MFKRHLILTHEISIYLMLNLWVKFRLGNINQGNIDLWGFMLESHLLELHFKTSLVYRVASSLHVTTNQKHVVPVPVIIVVIPNTSSKFYFVCDSHLYAHYVFILHESRMNNFTAFQKRIIFKCSSMDV